MKIIIATLLVVALAFQFSKAHPTWRASNRVSSIQHSETAKASYKPDPSNHKSKIQHSEKAKASYTVDNLVAVTFFVSDQVVHLYDGPGQNGDLLATLTLGSEASGNNYLAFDPNYPTGATTYFINLGEALGLGRGDVCTIFESEANYPSISPIRSVGADRNGNNIGREVFGEKTYTFWITFNEPDYILSVPTDNLNWEVQIVCVDNNSE